MMMMNPQNSDPGNPAAAMTKSMLYTMPIMMGVFAINMPAGLGLYWTISNLFGLEYDSRLLMGVDILSDTMPLVILNQDGDGSAWNWINAYGAYNSATKTFTPYPGFEASDEEIAAYVKQMNGVVQRKNKYAHLILEKNYYAYLFGK